MKKFISIVFAPVMALSFGTAVFAAGPAIEVHAEPAKATAKARLIDINAATEAQLIAVLGVGNDDAKNIIANRPYANKAQLKTKNVLPTATYEKIKRLIDAVC